jgi:hypothetical protein
VETEGDFLKIIVALLRVVRVRLQPIGAGAIEVQGDLIDRPDRLAIGADGAGQWVDRRAFERERITDMVECAFRVAGAGRALASGSPSLWLVLPIRRFDLPGRPPLGERFR